MLHLSDIFLGVYNHRRRQRNEKPGVLTEAALSILPKFRLDTESIADIRRAPCRRRHLVKSNAIPPSQLPTPPEPAHLAPSTSDYTHIPKVSTYRVFTPTEPPVISADDFEPELSDVEPSCVVCLEEYVVGDTVRVLPCGHVFHDGCICPWLLRPKAKFHECPICKTPCFSHEAAKKAEEEAAARMQARGNHPSNLISVF
ncbi:hypothetical protein GGI15_004915 [Coemansia interrupta]|uniref:RING-type domain-containing protein n=1 Tax=Coemansia interrupta TaxID=1126814 RepID=A0A9W8LEA8_9FUNG|nr:hypothetical protein GGI15_004915 [Coemansia interrupta]